MPNKTESIKMKGIWSSERKEGCFRGGKNKQKEGNLARNQHNNGGKQSTIQLSGIEIKRMECYAVDKTDEEYAGSPRPQKYGSNMWIQR
ncbi:hypothetical protein CEXT_188691 [Caerostris extrusa]|uniref:Uncharacterized protein n=1 Tax=Caerostris extrusa TaxID=172846 RepID=A0AAV4NJ15_CAEEX|nr:hypothetical protein CEXT_188691 [Caerostris extrusa]